MSENKAQIEMYSEPISKYQSLMHEAVEGRYVLTGYDMAVMEAAINQLADHYIVPDSIDKPIHEILELVASHFNVTVDQMKGKRQTSDIAQPRQVAMLMIDMYTNKSLALIGAIFNRSHCTVIHAKKTIKNSLETNGDLGKLARLLITKMPIEPFMTIEESLQRY